MGFIGYCILILTVWVAGSVVWTFERISKRTLKLLLGFSGAYLLTITVLELIPDVYQSGEKYVGVCVLLGFLLQILLEYLSEGIEHGHVHDHKHHDGRFPWFIMISLGVHAFFEGIPLGGDDKVLAQSMLTGIVLHNIPVSIALATMLVGSGLSRQRSFAFIVLFSLMSPAGAVLSSMAGSYINSVDLQMYMNMSMAVVIGIFLHVSTTIIFETADDHRFNFYKLGVMILGSLVASFLL